MPTYMSSLAGLLLVGVCLCISLVQADVKQLLAENEQQVGHGAADVTIMQHPSGSSLCSLATTGLSTDQNQ